MNSFYGAVKPEQIYITSINLSDLHTKNAVTPFQDNFLSEMIDWEQKQQKICTLLSYTFIHYTGPLTVSMKIENLTLYTLIIRTKSFKINGPERLSIKNFKLFSQPVIRIIFYTYYFFLYAIAPVGGGQLLPISEKLTTLF